MRQEGAIMAERRAVLRQRTFLKGVLLFHNGNSSEDCVVRDLTACGAQIDLPHRVAPEVCDLLVPSRELRVRARAVWRNGARRGLQFEAAQAPPAPKPRPPALDDNRY
jgi:hypothetical protein